MSGIAQYRRARILGWAGSILFLVLAVIVPVGYFCVRWEHEKAISRLQASHDAREVSHLIAQQGDDWREYIQGATFALFEHMGDGPASVWILQDSHGAAVIRLDMFHSHLKDVLLQYGYVASSPVLQNGVPVATVAVHVSPEAALGVAAWLALLSLLPCGLLVTSLHAWPVRVVGRARATVSALTLTDATTGLPNRVAVGKFLTSALEGTHYRGDKIGVILLDLLRFRDINDLYGKEAADRILKQVGERLSRHLHISEQLASMGGDEFMLLVPAITSVDQAAEAAERLAAVLAAPFSVGVERVVLTPRLGIAVSETAEETAEVLLQQAALALRAVKSENASGLSTRVWHVYNPTSDAGPLIRRQMKEDLSRALQEKQLRLVYQPQVNLLTGQITGAEALLRWNHPVRGNVPPDVFIPAAEEAELIVEIGAFVLWEACAQAAQWPDITMAINVSPLQFQQPDFVTSIRVALEAFNLPPHRLEIEITENMLLQRTEESLAKVAQLRALGVRIVIDDFGIGYANIGMLRRFRFNKIKIDRSFISDLAHDPQARSIVRAVVEVGRAMGATINAEGVEDEEQNRLLRVDGCQEVQGYLHGRPMMAADFKRRLLENRQRPAEPAVLSVVEITAA